nr:unnamed protein product [Digitaria exilis]
MPSMEEVLRRDELRARYIQRMFSGSTNGDNVQQSAEVSVPTVLGSAYLDTLQYVITVGLGSPAATQNVLIDTGSDISWVQCAPCSECHSQADQLFDPSSSSTYSPFSCDSQACTQLGQEGNGCSSSQCQYIVRYVDGSYTAGTYGSDTLTLGSDAITSFQFGCSSDESGVDTDTLTDGLMGLGRGPQSLAFSYCLPPSPSSTGFLTLGASSGGGGGSGFATTPMVASDVNPTDTARRAVVTDSGTIVTRLPPTAYSALSSAFEAGMSQYLPAQDPNNFFDTCFDFSSLGNGEPPSVPEVSLVFAGGAVVNLAYDGIMEGNCLAFKANEDDSSLSTIGNIQQRTFEVLYDVGQSTVGFRAGAC